MKGGSEEGVEIASRLQARRKEEGEEDRQERAVRSRERKREEGGN